ncbi:MAG: beta-L-arabinofuranosidase domain-containing protein [Chryseolinea sp.]
MKKLALLFLVTIFASPIQSQQLDAKLQAIGFSQVQIIDKFWQPRIQTVTDVTIPVCIEQTEIKTPRIRNFEKVARKKGEKHEGIYFDDSDVYKALEAIAYSLKNTPNPALENKADEWIDKIAAAQEPDGYLNTFYSLNGLQDRWSDMEKHEDYCAGHLIEAATAYYNTTGKRKLLDVAVRFADHIDATFRLPNRHWVSGHQEIELALVKLYRVTNNKKYLDLADWFLRQRGKGFGKGVIWDQWKQPSYCQDALPVKEQTSITGHAVRAMYLFTGAADVAAASNDAGYMNSMKHVWDDVVLRNMYITGGIGSSGSNEGFTTDYDLPNEQAYCETCASVGMVFWNQRMNLLTGESKYIDVLERSLYNGALDGLSLSGDRFFYGNPLASSGNNARSEWFGTACCPSNIARLVESIGDYIYARGGREILVNLFVGSKTTVSLVNEKVSITQVTNYPWDGNVEVSVEPTRKISFELKIRIPGWASGEPVPGDTYKFLDALVTPFTLILNGKPVKYSMAAGYATIDRQWRSGDKVTLSMPMPVQRIVAIDSIHANIDRVALQRGPLMYCFEHADNNNSTNNILLPDNVSLTHEYKSDLLNGIVVVHANAPVVQVSESGLDINTKVQPVLAIPYFTWANRGKGEMTLWIPRKAGKVAIITK